MRAQRAGAKSGRKVRAQGAGAKSGRQHTSTATRWPTSACKTSIDLLRAPQARVQRIPQAISEEIEGKHGDR